MRMEATIGTRLVVAECDPVLAPQAGALMKTLADIDKKDRLRDGMVVEFGWVPLRLTSNSGTLLVEEPDFDHNPLSSYVQSVSVTLRVLRDQARLAQSLGLSIETTPRFDHKLLIVKDTLQEGRLYALRSRPPLNDDSGWEIGPPPANDAPDQLSDREFHGMFVFELVRHHALMSILPLPRGYLCVIEEDEIEAIYNDKDRMVLPAA
jgi:hypothetical protein